MPSACGSDTCVANVCSSPTTPVDGYVLPTCSGVSTGSIACDPLPVCADGYYGTPNIDGVTCATDGAELSVSGCTACTAVENSAGVVTCSSGDDSQVTRCTADAGCGCAPGALVFTFACCLYCL